jgi:hypothetical protein
MSEFHHKLDEYLHVTSEIARVYVFSILEAMVENFQSIYKARNRFQWLTKLSRSQLLPNFESQKWFIVIYFKIPEGRSISLGICCIYLPSLSTCLLPWLRLELRGIGWGCLTPNL